MHSTIFNFNDEIHDLKDIQYTEDIVYEMMSQERELDDVKEITDGKELDNLITYLSINLQVDLRAHMEVKSDGIVIHMPYDTLIDAMYRACDDLGEYWFINDGYEMVTMKDYFRILLLNHMGEDQFDMKLVQAWDYHY